MQIPMGVQEVYTYWTLSDSCKGGGGGGKKSEQFCLQMSQSSVITIGSVQWSDYKNGVKITLHHATLLWVNV